MSPDRRKAALRWSILFGGVTAAVIGVVVSLWLIPRFNGKNGADEARVIPEAKVRISSRFPSPSQEQAIDLVTRAIENRDLDQVESLFRTNSAGHAEVVNFCKGLKERDGAVERYDWLSSMDVDGLLVEGVLVVFKGKDKPRERLAFLTPDSTGQWKMDYEAFARPVIPSWDQLLEKSWMKSARVRVLVASDVYFNGPFSDDKQWVCYKIVSPDTEQLLRGYCRVGSPQAAGMKKLFVEGVTASRATLEIQRVKDGGPSQFEIMQLVGQDWIIPDSAGAKN